MTLTFPATATVRREAFWLQAEPLWPVEGLPNPGYDAWVRVYCDLDTRSTVAVTADTTVWGDENGTAVSWVGYEWAADGSCWTLAYGPVDHTDCRWWEVDDLLWGALGDSVLSVVDATTHTLRSREEIARRCFESGLVAPAAVARTIIEQWWGPLTAADEVRLGLTEAEAEEQLDNLWDLFKRL